MRQPKRLFAGLLVAALLGAAGYAYYRAQAQQTATLARITALETRLMASNQQRARAASQAVFRLTEQVSKNHHVQADVAVLEQAQEIRARTQTLLDTLHQLRQSWQTAPPRAELNQLPAQVAQYLVFIKRFLPDVSPQLTSAHWLGNFDAVAAPKPAALALLTKLETQVWQLAAEALEQQAQKVASCWTFDKIGAFAMPVSNTVAPGAIYRAQLLLVESVTSGRMHFSADGRAVPIDPATGQALVQLNVPAARPGQPDTLRAAWHGRVQLPGATGDTVLATTVPYFIVKPAQR